MLWRRTSSHLSSYPVSTAVADIPGVHSDAQICVNLAERAHYEDGYMLKRSQWYVFSHLTAKVALTSEVGTVSTRKILKQDLASLLTNSLKVSVSSPGAIFLRTDVCPASGAWSLCPYRVQSLDAETGTPYDFQQGPLC